MVRRASGRCQRNGAPMSQPDGRDADGKSHPEGRPVRDSWLRIKNVLDRLTSERQLSPSLMAQLISSSSQRMEAIRQRLPRVISYLQELERALNEKKGARAQDGDGLDIPAAFRRAPKEGAAS